MGFDKEGYWSPREILGYNAKYNIILSERGRGKTVALKKLMVQQDGEFMCLYRDGKDLEHSIKSSRALLSSSSSRKSSLWYSALRAR